MVLNENMWNLDKVRHSGEYRCFFHDNVCTSCCVLPDILQRNFLECENLGSQKGAQNLLLDGPEWGKKWSSVFIGDPFGLMQWKSEFYFFVSTNQSKGIMLLIGQHVEYKKKMVKTDLRIEW